METLEPRAGFLCNFEVLHFLKQQRDERAAEVKVLSEAKAARVSKLGRKAYAREQEDEEIERVQPPELHTISFECIKFLEDEVHPMRRQTVPMIKTLLDKLADFVGTDRGMGKQKFTHAECLQLVNLAPEAEVALFVIIEDCEARFSGNEHLAILKLIRDSLVAKEGAIARSTVEQVVEQVVDDEDDDMGEQEDEEEFVNEGLGGAGESNAKELDEVE